MGLQKERIERSWKQQGPCFMIKIFPCIYGQRLPKKWCMYRTVLYIEYSRTRHLKKCSLARNQRSEVIYLRIFGCLVYIHIPKEKRTKLDPFGKKGIFVGYTESSKSYMIYFLGLRRLTSAET